MDSPVDADGTTLRKQLQHVEKQTGKTPPQLIPPCKFPQMASKVWSIYKEGFMPFKLEMKPLTYQELQCYLELTNESLRMWEVNAIMMLDTTYLTKIVELRNGTSS